MIRRGHNKAAYISSIGESRQIVIFHCLSDTRIRTDPSVAIRERVRILLVFFENEWQTNSDSTDSARLIH